MLEYAEKFEELIDDALNNLSTEMFSRLLELIQDSVETHK